MIKKTVKERMNNIVVLSILLIRTIKKPINKSIKNIVVLSILLISLFGFIGSEPVEASQINSVTPTGYTHTGTAYGNDGSFMWFDRQSIDQIIVDGQVGFCIEPWVLVNDKNNYVSSLYNDERLSFVVYHGYWNTGRSFYDYVVTQLLIWEQMGYTPTHNVPNYAERKQEILNAVNTHKSVPSFSGSNITLNKGESITLTDTNNVLSQFQIIGNTANVDYAINGNQLTIKAKEGSVTNQPLTLAKYRDSFVMGASLVYRRPNSQSVVVMKLGDPIYLNLNLKFTNGKLKFDKTGETFMTTELGSTELGSFYKPLWQKEKLLGSEISIASAEQINDHSGNKIYDKDQIIDFIESTYDEDVSIDLPQGKYYWWESKVPHGYIEDLSKNYFEVTGSGGINQSFNANLVNDRAEQIFVFNKQMEKHFIKNYNNDNAYKDVRFGIFAKEDITDYKGRVAIENGTMVDQFLIDKTGSAKETRQWNDLNNDGLEDEDELTYTDFKLDLPNGLYVLKELATNPMYELDTNEYPFEISYQGQGVQNITIEINDRNEIVNTFKKFKVQVNKVDSDTKEAVVSNDFAFGLYSNKECTQLVEKVNANTVKGIALFERIISGEWWIKELSAPKGYELSQEVKHLVINEEGVFVDGKEVTEENSVYSFVYENTLLPSISTGDTTNQQLYIVMAITSMLIGVAVIHGIKKKSEK